MKSILCFAAALYFTILSAVVSRPLPGYASGSKSYSVITEFTDSNVRQYGLDVPHDVARSVQNGLSEAYMRLTGKLPNHVGGPLKLSEEFSKGFWVDKDEGIKRRTQYADLLATIHNKLRKAIEIPSQSYRIALYEDQKFTDWDKVSKYLQQNKLYKLKQFAAETLGAHWMHSR